MKTFLKSWKTSVIGLILIGVSIYMYITTGDWTQPGAVFAVGAGFLFAKDGNVTGGTQ